MTPYQVREVYLHARHDNGAAKIDPPQHDFRQWFVELWRGRGLRDDQIATKWAEYVEANRKGNKQ